MSSVTNVIITASTLERTSLLNEINALFPSRYLLPVQQHAGGNKQMEAQVFLGAINYLDEVALLQHLHERVKWVEPDGWRVFMQTQQGNHFEDVTSCKPWLDVWNQPIPGVGLNPQATHEGDPS